MKLLLQRLWWYWTASYTLGFTVRIKHHEPKPNGQVHQYSDSWATPPTLAAEVQQLLEGCKCLGCSIARANAGKGIDVDRLNRLLRADCLLGYALRTQSSALGKDLDLSGRPN